MSTEELYEELQYVSASRENRLKYAQIVLNDLSLLPKLISILFMINDKTSCRAAWVLEFVCNDHIEAMVPHLDMFTKNLKKLHLDSAVRPIAKICALISKTYASRQQNPFKTVLTPSHKELIIETCFDWMISDQKVAVKVHAMETLFWFGKEGDWIHAELTIILQQDFHTQSAAFQARAKHILKRLKKEPQ